MAAKPLHPVYSLTPRPAGPPLRWRRLLLVWLVLLGLFGYLATLWHHPGDNLPLAGQIGVMALLFSPLLLTWWELRRWHRLAPPVPPGVALEWMHGRQVPPEGAPVLAPPQRFRHRGHWLELRADGVLIAPATLMVTSRSSEWRDAWAAYMAAASARQSFVAWDEITAWEVRCDDDRPDHYALRLRQGGPVEVRRFRPDGGHEADVLDAVRAIGRVPVRLFDSLPAA